MSDSSNIFLGLLCLVIGIGVLRGIGIVAAKLWRQASASLDIEISIVRARLRKWSPFGKEIIILLVIAFFLGGFLTTLRVVKKDAFAWVVFGLPTCVMLGRYWWKSFAKK